ncbi:MBL fold metallo-hydrolase [Oculatella sp. LEGE 06141]|uniref:MBL fold metallo-hydrolase n=1 Tax=Oculatella sp. LEGE 06141 TaxID=1828648 RepID=UPI00187E995E|nr:MBL fold metallo-hydrolase [Oculatella sp. LEGE 06141]MBE9181242.1 MBL fold metallo-hydrolase [Oculatella sp. LEGE 06141]
MKALHRSDLYCWSTFDLDRKIDFNSLAWVRPGGTILIDPLPMAAHDLDHLLALGKVAWIVITNSDHCRAAKPLAHVTGAKLAAPIAEQETFPIQCDRWLADNDEVVPGLTTLALHGSKTPGELALLLEGTTLITGDLIRSHQAGRLMILPTEKLRHPEAAIASVHRLASLPPMDAVLVGDGWSVFRDGSQRLRELTHSLQERFHGNV